jgi:uncharacterized membrane protein YfcA
VTSIGAVAAVAAAGVAAGTINAVVGSGTLITFPVLLSLGVPPVTANVSNTIGLVPGSFSGAWGYRRELTGQRDRLLRLGVASFLGGVTGAVLLLVLPANVFKAVVPVLIVAALILVVTQPRLARRFVGAAAPPVVEPVAVQSAETVDPAMMQPAGPVVAEAIGPAVAPEVTARSRYPLGRHPVWLLVLVFGTGVYGGYFGAAQGVLLVAIMGMLLDTNLQRVNGMKNMLAGVVNGVAGILFAILSHPNWVYVAIIAVGSTIGGQLGAHIGRRLRPMVLRGVIVVVGIAALIKFLL